MELFGDYCVLIRVLVLSAFVLFVSIYLAKTKLYHFWRNTLCCGGGGGRGSDKNKNNKMEFKGGQFNFNVPLAKYTRFRVGGPAQILFRPTDLNNLTSVLKRRPQNLEVIPIGMGSNLLVRDDGVRAMVVLLSKGFQEFKVLRDNSVQIEVGAGLSQLKFSKLAAKAGIGGLEFFCGIPGSIGGALRMNAGAHGTEVKDKLISARVVDSNGGVHNLTASELGYSYRHCSIPKDWIFVSAVFQGERKSQEEILKKMSCMLHYRDEKQPVKEKTAGCTFANPGNGLSAWELIRDAGCQDMRIRGAEVSVKHSNFLVNSNYASAQDLEDLGNAIQLRVHEKCGTLLRWEVERIGEPFHNND